jgi:leucyl aminopeptidase
MARSTASQKATAAATLSIQTTTALPAAADAVAVAIFEKTTALPSHMKAIDAATGGALARAIALGDFKGKVGTVSSIPLAGGIKRLLIAGLGKRDAFDIDNLRWAAASVAKAARKAKMASVVLYLHGELPDATTPTAVGEAIAEGITLSGFSYDEFKKPQEEEDKKIATSARFSFYEPDAAFHAETKTGLATGAIIGEAANYTRLLSCKPGNVINPQTLVAEALAFARREKIKATIIDHKKAAALGMGGIVGVGQGSNAPPALILLEYVGPGAAKQKPIAIVGKAVTFDTGGISIKPAADMDAMKYDKCGGMAVLGILQAAARLKLPVRIVGVIPTAENTLSENAYRPGDILRFYNGKTAEITNTDAEGRLILADALAYAADVYKPAAIIDMATLTGGVVVALGSVYAGLFANNDVLAEALETAGRASGELLWRLPLHDRYKPLMEGYHADLVNSGPRGAHPVQGAIFLQHFVLAEIPWAHLDIAGTAFPAKDDRYLVRGATGFGVRVVTEYLRRLAK